MGVQRVFLWQSSRLRLRPFSTDPSGASCASRNSSPGAGAAGSRPPTAIMRGRSSRWPQSSRCTGPTRSGSPTSPSWPWQPATYLALAIVLGPMADEARSGTPGRAASSAARSTARPAPASSRPPRRRPSSTAASKAAVEHRRPLPGCVFHEPTGAGSHASRPHRALLRRHGFVGSMSRRANPYDNAAAESLIKTRERSRRST